MMRPCIPETVAWCNKPAQSSADKQVSADADFSAISAGGSSSDSLEVGVLPLPVSIHEIVQWLRSHQ